MDVFVVRQPILDRARRTYAYTLVVRGAQTNVFRRPPAEDATAITAALGKLLSGRSLTGKRRAFLNLTRDTLVAARASIARHPSVAFEVPASGLDPELVEACRHLRRGGRLIAVGGVAPGSWSSELVQLADFVKVDFSRSSLTDRNTLAAHFRRLGVRLVAQNVSTPADWRQAQEAGYDYFEGEAFFRPVLVTDGEIPVSRLNVLRILHEIYQPDADLARIERVIRAEVSMPLKLLTYVNTSAGYGFRQKLTSVRQALLLMGVEGIRRWAAVIALADAAGDAAREVVVASVVRARFCELLAADAGLGTRAEDAFLMGLFSLLDTLVGRPLHELLAPLAIADEVREALLNGRNTLRRILELVIAYERADWNAVVRWAVTLTLDPRVIPDRYCAAVEWAQTVAIDPPR